MKILIVGAGPTGLTAAVELARHGIIAEVIDCKDEASTLSRAVGIIPRSLNLLDPSGVSKRLLNEGIKIRQAKGYLDNKLTLTLHIQDAHPVHDYILALAQDRTEVALQDTFIKYGGTVRYKTALKELQQNDAYVIAQTKDGNKVKYDYVIGADGVRSTTRKSLGLEYSGFELPETWSIADVNAKDWPNPETFTFCLLSNGRVVVVVPLEPDRYRIISNTENALATLPLDLNIINIKREGQFKISIRQVNQYGLGHVYLAGDAAHCHSPVGGRGMNLGIADAAELAQRMVDGTLSGYSESRHAEGAKIIAGSEHARKFLTSKNFITRLITKSGFRLINVSSTLQRLIAKTLLGS